MGLFSKEPQLQARVPAWKKLGLKLKAQSDAAADAALAVPREPNVVKNRSLESRRDASLSATSPLHRMNGDRQEGGASLKRARERDGGSEFKREKRFKTNSNANARDIGSTERDDFSARAVQAAVRNPWGNGIASNSQNNHDQSRPRRIVFSPESPDHPVGISLPPVQSEVAITDYPGPASPVVKDSDLSKGARKKKRKSKSTLLQEEAPSQTNESQSEQPIQTPQTRRKSVTFTPDTKAGDGDSASHLFKSFVAQNWSGRIDPQLTDEQASEVNAISSERETKRVKNKKKMKVEASAGEPAEDPKERWVFVRYLHTYANDPPNWKFNKSHQTDLLKNIFNMWRVPSLYEDAVIQYIAGLRGSGVRGRLHQSAKAALKDAEADIEKLQSVQSQEANMGIDEMHKVTQEALEERLQKEKNRRKRESEENYLQSTEFKQLLAKRRRAEAVLQSLGPIVESSTQMESTQESGAQTQATRDVRNRLRTRKKRTEVPDDDMTSSSEEDISSSSDSTSSSDESESESGSDSDSGSGSESEGSESSSESDASSESNPYPGAESD